MKRRGLGRGLDALIPSSGSGDQLEERSPLVDAPIDAITPNPNQPRRDFDDESIGELADSIRQLGVLQPLLVRQVEGGRFELIAGERRLRAARRAGLDRVPALVLETDEQGSLERALVENVQRADLNPIEEAAAYRQLIEEGGLTQEGMAQRVGKNRVTITNSLRLLDLPTSIQSMLTSGRLTAGHGRALIGLQGHPFQERMAQRVAGEGWSVRETEDRVRRYRDLSVLPSERGPRAGASARAEVVEAQRRLADHLHTRVKVEMGKRKGKIILDFVSLEDLERILSAIEGERPRTTRIVIPE